MMGTFTQDYHFESHPSLHGHFPGDPVMPGVVLLETVMQAIKARLPSRRIRGLQSIKFHRPVRPGDRFTITLDDERRDSVRFRCVIDDQIVCSGDFIFDSPP